MTVFAVPAVDSARGRQMTALLAAAHLAEHGLSEVACWEVTADGRLSVQARTPGSAAGELAAVHAWATFLGSDMHVREGLGGAVRVIAEATYRSAPVEVWITARLPEPTDPQGER